jgi:hypothetical protein
MCIYRLRTGLRTDSGYLMQGILNKNKTVHDNLNMQKSIFSEEYYRRQLIDDMNKKHVNEDVDAGHRHFSSMHWLYPGLFQPTNDSFTDVVRLYTSARDTLAYKRRSGGGHTSWSSAWEACLWARLGDNDR